MSTEPLPLPPASQVTASAGPLIRRIEHGAPSAAVPVAVGRATPCAPCAAHEPAVPPTSQSARCRLENRPYRFMAPMRAPKRVEAAHDSTDGAHGVARPTLSRHGMVAALTLAGLMSLTTASLRGADCDPRVPVQFRFHAAPNLTQSRMWGPAPPSTYTLRLEYSFNRLEHPIEVAPPGLSSVQDVAYTWETAEHPYRQGTLLVDVGKEFVVRGSLLDANELDAPNAWVLLFSATLPEEYRDCLELKCLGGPCGELTHSATTCSYVVVNKSGCAVTFHSQTIEGDTLAGCASGPRGALAADDTTQILAHVACTDDVTCWALVGDSLGCSLLPLGAAQGPGGGSFALITPAGRGGLLDVVARDRRGCVYAGQLALEAERRQCDECLRFATLTTDLGSALVKIHLGLDRYLHDAGYLYLDESKGPADKLPGERPIDPEIQIEGPLKHRLTQRAAFRCLIDDLRLKDAATGLPNSEVFHDKYGRILKVRVPSGLIVIDDVLDAQRNVALDQIEVNCYDNSQYNSDAPRGASVAPYPGASPLSSIRLINPDGNAAFDDLWVRETRGSTARTYRYHYQSGKWQLSVEGSDEIVEQSETLTESLRIMRRSSWRITGPGQQVCLSDRFIERKKINNAWRRIKDRVGSEETLYRYYGLDDATPVGSPKYGQLKSVLYPDGRWAYYADYDALRRLTKKLTPLHDAALPDAGAPNEANCRSEEYDYARAFPWDEPDRLEIARPRTIVRKVQTREVGRVYQACYLDTVGGVTVQVQERYVCPQPETTALEAYQSSADRLVLKSVVRHRVGPWPHFPPVLHSMANPDGTAVWYAHTHSIRDGALDPGDPAAYAGVDYPYESDPLHDAAGNGWRWQDAALAVIERRGYVDAYGGFHALSETESRTGLMGELQLRLERDTSGGLTGEKVLARERYYPTRQGGAPDPLRWSYRVETLDGASAWVEYDCCGLHLTIDKEQTTTIYGYDDWKRPTRWTTVSDALTGAGVRLERILDIDGRVLREERVGTDGQTRTTLNQYFYDCSGRLTAQVNAVQGTTTYADTTLVGKRRLTTTLPEGGQRIETYYRDGHLEQVTGTAAAPVRFDRGVAQLSEDGLMAWRAFERQTKLTRAGTPTDEWTINYFDGANRLIREVFSPRPGLDSPDAPPNRRFFYNAKGQLWKQIDADGVTTLFGYSPAGELECHAVATDPRATATGNEPDYGYIDRNTDRYRRTVTALGYRPESIQQTTALIPVRRTTVRAGTDAGEVVVSVQETDRTGLTNWHTLYRDPSAQGAAAVTTKTVTAYPAPRGRLVTAWAPDGSATEQVYYYGDLYGTILRTASGAVLDSTSYSYADPFRRLQAVTDGRGQTTTYGYDVADQLTTVTMPAAEPGQPPQTTLASFDREQRLTRIQYPDQTMQMNSYYPNGLLKLTYGSRTYPAGYAYDAQGRLETLATWRSFPGPQAFDNPAAPQQASVTTWIYDRARGWLTGKRYADGKGPNYHYTSGGRLRKREWSRLTSSGQLLTTTYRYDFDPALPADLRGPFADLKRIEYNDPVTPAITFAAYDRLGRVRQVRRQDLAGAGETQTSLEYNHAGQLMAESYRGGPLDGLAATTQYDQHLRRQSFALNTRPQAVTVSYLYTDASRLHRVSSQSGSASFGADYTYLPNVPWVQALRQGLLSGATLVTRLTVEREYDRLGRIKTVTDQPSLAGQPQLSFRYAHHTAGERRRLDLADGSYWEYDYDALGQLELARRFWTGGQLVAGQQFAYEFDHMGNRVFTQAGGDTAGAGLRLAQYVPRGAPTQSLNQYEYRTVPRYLEVQGAAQAPVTVTVKGLDPVALDPTVTRQGEYYRAELNFGARDEALYERVQIGVPGAPAREGRLWLAPNPESFTYDNDGNLTQDGRWRYTWDGENRLLKIESLPNAPAHSARSIAFTYDYRGRLVQREEAGAARTRFAYNGWQCVAELDATTNPAAPTLARAYLWGL
ncbi:MAG: RHS repeat protein, partial [Verrucomicrobia bacterium]|nr:RHS repeat protein [Verrucomicrobiota bacterium]